MKIRSILISCLVFLVFMELGLRLVRPDALEFYRIQKQIHSYNDEYLVDLEPNVDVRIRHFQDTFDIRFSTNSSGYRSKEVDNSFPQIGCIGDSVTMGFGVSNEDTFCSKLDGYTDKEGNVYRSVNLGVDAYGPSAIEKKLSRELPKLNIKLLFYFPSNGDDIDEYNFYSKMNNKNAKLFFKIQFLASKYSYLFLALKVTQEQMLFRFRETFIDPIDIFYNSFHCIFSDSKDFFCKYTSLSTFYLNLLSDFKKPHKGDKNAPPIFKPSECQNENDPHPIPESVFSSTKKIVELSRRLNIKLVFFLSPIDIETAYCSQLHKSHRLYNYSMSLKKFLENEKFNYVDLNEYTGLMKDSKGNFNVRPYYIIGDGHYTALGNMWVYERLKIIAEKELP